MTMRIFSKPRANVLFLSLLANIDSDWKTIATRITKFLRNINVDCNICNCCWRVWHCRFPSWLKTRHLIAEDKEYSDIIKKIIKQIDHNIKDIKLTNDKWWKRKVKIVRNIYSDWKPNWYKEFDLEDKESVWTNRFIELIWPIIKTVIDWWILFIDEIDSSRHYTLAYNILEFLGDNRKSWKPYQVIVNTHTIWLLDLDLFRKDQIRFINKDEFWVSDLYSLDDFKELKIRNSSDIMKAYINWALWWTQKLSDFNI